MLHVPGMPEGVHVSFSPEHGPALSTAQPDPVFALIEAHRAAYATWEPVAAVWNEAIGGTPEYAAAEAAAEEPGRREREAFRALLEARPATAAGLWALTAYLPEATRKVSPDAQTEEQAALDVLREGALRLGLATVQAEVRAASASHIDPMLAAIERHRLAHHAYGEAVTAADPVSIKERGGDDSPGALALLDAREDDASVADMAAWREIFAVQPTTVGGYVALLRHLDRHWQSFDGMDDEPDVLGALVEMLQGLALPAASTTPAASHAEEAGTILDKILISQVQELVAIEASQDLALKVTSFADAYDSPDWVRMEGDREKILAQVIATRAHTMEGVTGKASLLNLDSVKNFQEPFYRLSQSIAADVAALGILPRSEQTASPASSPADPHAALLPALRQAFAWTREAQPFCDEPQNSPEGRAFTAVVHHCWDLSNRIVALPAPVTPTGLGAVALALSVWGESSIGLPQNDGLDHERYPEGRRLAAAVRAMMTASGVSPLAEWAGFGDEPDSQARWDAMLERVGEGSLPAWALAGKTGPDDGEIATDEEVTPAIAPAPAAPAQPPVSDLAWACIDQVERMAQWGRCDKSVGRSDQELDADLDQLGAVLRRAIEEPSANAADLAAKARLMLADMKQFKEEEERTQDDERLMLVILREAVSLVDRGSAALPTRHPDATLLALGMPFLAAWRDEGAADPVSNGKWRELPAGGETFDEAHARCSVLADRIAALPVATVEGLGIKALAMVWCKSETGNPANPMPEPHRSSTASDLSLMWQIQVNGARILAGATGIGGEPPEEAAGPVGAALDLSACSVTQVARLYEVFQGTYEHISALGQLGCFWTEQHGFNPAGDIIDREVDRLGAMIDVCANEVAQRNPAPGFERNDALCTLVAHEMRCNGRIHDPALLRDIATAWGA